MANVKITGAKQLERNLLKLQKLADSSSPSSKAINKALNTGLNPIQSQAKQSTPKDSGILKKSLKKKALRSRRRNLFTRILGYAADFKSNKKQVKADYAGAVEQGTKNQKGKFMLEKAYDSKKKAVFKATLDKLSAEINKEIKKLSI